ncbi:hypothetical protein ACEQ8H_006213 [Pleosporales sp. CAS-2024a]
MWTSTLSTLLSLFAATAAAQSATPSNGSVGPDADGKYTISAEGIRARFIPYGASISELYIKGKDGVERDVVLGFDKVLDYEASVHPHFGGVPGRYANRIKNSTFTIDGQTYHILPNENNNNDTLHGGPYGWDYRNFTLVSHTSDSITFSIVDPDGEQGFPGEVISYITYTTTPNTWKIKIMAMATTKKTPIMLTSHTYWNLDGFANPDTPYIFNHTLHLPYSGQRTGVDNILIPDGSILPNQQYSVNDFWSAPKQIGANYTSPELVGNCGFNCTGYDTCYIVNRAQNGPYDWRQTGPVASLSSAWSGIKVDIYSDQEAFQMYSCPGQDGTIPLKKSQGVSGRPAYVQKNGCVVMEVQDWIGAINQPEWQRESRQIFGPDTKSFSLEADYVFSTSQ